MADLASQPSPPPRSPTDLFSDPVDSTPLWFNKSAFQHPSFDPESYISDLRSFVPLDTLRSHLRSHLSSLNHDLVDLINRDYADFVSLSTKLIDIDSAVARMRSPLADLRDKIAQFRGNVEASLAALQNGLRQRKEASEAREILELLLDTFHVVSKVEKLIKELPGVPADWSTGDVASLEKVSLSNGVLSQQIENETNLRETQSMLLERIASEMNRLKFYIAHAQNLPFIENMETRIKSASLLLDGSLGHCFVAGLEQRDANAIYNCLRAYAAIDNTAGAEELFRTTVVSPMIQKIIPYGSSEVVNGASSDELEEDYRQIMKSTEIECKFLLEISSAGYCSSRSAVSKFRAEAVYVEFMKQWNVGEIAGALDAALVASAINPIQDLHPTKEDSKELMLKQSNMLIDSLRACWKEDVLLFSCSDRFLRLSLQLLSRYSTWLSFGLAARKAGSAGQHPGSEWAVAATPNDFVYGVCFGEKEGKPPYGKREVLHDIGCLVNELNGDFLANVLQLLISCPSEVLDSVKISFMQGRKSLLNLEPIIVDTMIEAIVEKSVEDLRQLKGITATYRMTNKPLPVRHSPYVSGVLRPLKAFLDGERARFLTSDVRNRLLHGAAERITGRYYELAAELVSVARKTESSLLRIRQGAQRRAGASSDASDHNISDTDKICMQLFLDVQEYGRNLAALGVAAADIPTYRSLWQCVAPQDRQTEIRF
ncbi:hypothetical protein ACLOJK_039842 [Asimina triloba]